MSVAYAIAGDTFVPEKPRVWMPTLSGTAWDLAPDGKHVVVLTAVEAPRASPPKQEHTIVLLQNFFDELRRRVPIN
jgi:hypothetical protein